MESENPLRIDINVSVIDQYGGCFNLNQYFVIKAMDLQAVARVIARFCERMETIEQESGVKIAKG